MTHIFLAAVIASTLFRTAVGEVPTVRVRSYLWNATTKPRLEPRKLWTAPRISYYDASEPDVFEATVCDRALTRDVMMLLAGQEWESDRQTDARLSVIVEREGGSDTLSFGPTSVMQWNARSTASMDTSLLRKISRSLPCEHQRAIETALGGQAPCTDERKAKQR